MNAFFRYIGEYRKNSEMRVTLSLLFGLVLNAIYIVFNLVVGIAKSNVWFITVSAYYVIIFIIRTMLVGNKIESSAIYQIGEIMLVLGIALTGMIIYTILTDRGEPHSPFVLTYLFGYVLFCVIRAVLGIRCAKRENKSSHRAVYTIRLSEAFVSLFTFQTSLLSTFTLSRAIVLTLNFITGSAVLFSVFYMSTKMINN